jgi:hypothetical protein
LFTEKDNADSGGVVPEGMTQTISVVIPEAVKRLSGIHTHYRGYGFSDVQLHITACASRIPE